jgi:hypothetical protein
MLQVGNGQAPIDSESVDKFMGSMQAWAQDMKVDSNVELYRYIDMDKYQ